jgi:hypothetical protein
MFPTRNTSALTGTQIEYCTMAWALITQGGLTVPLDLSRARSGFTTTGYSETDRKVFLGANAYPGLNAVDANARMSVLACLAHEYAHVERHALAYSRPKELPDVLLDEAETSIHASFHRVLGRRDREDLVEDARDRLMRWLAWSATSPSF